MSALCVLQRRRQRRRRGLCTINFHVSVVLERNVDARSIICSTMCADLCAAAQRHQQQQSTSAGAFKTYTHMHNNTLYTRAMYTIAQEQNNRTNVVHAILQTQNTRMPSAKHTYTHVCSNIDIIIYLLRRLQPHEA